MMVMIDKVTLHSYSNRPYDFRRKNKGLLKKLILLVFVVLVLFFGYGLIFSQSIAKKNLEQGQKLQEQGKIQEATEKFDKSARKAKYNSATFESSLIGLWSCNRMDLTKKYAEKAIAKKSDQIKDTYQDILIIENKKDEVKNPKNEITKIAYQVFFEDKIATDSEIYKDLINKINSAYSKETKKIIFAQYLNQNKMSYFGTEIARQVVEKDKNYRDAQLALGYGYLKNHNLEAAKNILLQAVELDPVYPDTYQILAMVYKELGQNENYKSCIAKAKSLKSAK
jgi:Tfp pilus assembly protein PilF